VVRRFLWASYLDRVDRDQAEREFAALRGLALTLRPCVGEYAGTAGLSPARSPLPDVPVFLLHGRDDTVIPADESERLAERLRNRTRIRLLLTDLISHADADQPAHTADGRHDDSPDGQRETDQGPMVRS
jgi:pimeloyl-ACP methyl ester carboxylesterase